MKIKKYIAKFGQAHWLFVIVSLIAGTFFCALTPPLWGLDEPSHFSRAYQIANGEFILDTSTKNRGGMMPDNFLELANYRNIDILDGWDNGSVLSSKDVIDQSVYSRLGNEMFTTSKHNFSTTAGYSPVSYVGAIIGIVVSNILNFTISQTIFTARFFSLVSYIIMASMAIWLVRKMKLKWLFTALALIPTSIFLSSTVSADTVTLGLSLLFFALFCRVVSDVKIDKRLIFLLALVSILLPLTKINYIFISAVFLIIPNKLFKSKKLSYLYKFITLSLAIVFSVIWTLLAKPAGAPTQRGDLAPVLPIEQSLSILQNPFNAIAVLIKSLILNGDVYYKQLFSTISGNSIFLPIVSIVILSIVILATAFYAKEDLLRMRKYVAFLTVASFACTLSIFVTLYILFTPVGLWRVDGVQGRYFTPLIVVAAMFIATFMPVYLELKKATVRTMVVATSILCLMVSIVYIYLSLF